MRSLFPIRHAIMQRGFSLLEVLISLVVLSVGLLGIAGLETSGMRYTYTSSLWNSAALYAQNMVDRMRANPGCINNGASATTCSSTGGVIGGNYDAVTPSSVSSSPPTCTSSCTSSQIATMDVTGWENGLTNNLPSGSGSVLCATPNYCDQSNYVSQAVYVITVCWDGGNGTPPAACGASLNASTGTVSYTSDPAATYQLTVLPALP